MRRVIIMISVAMLSLPVVALAQQATTPAPLDHQQLLERALSREGSLQSLCAQNREDLIKYFQQEIREERKKTEAALQQVEQLKKASAPAQEQK